SLSTGGASRSSGSSSVSSGGSSRSAGGASLSSGSSSVSTGGASLSTGGASRGCWGSTAGAAATVSGAASKLAPTVRLTSTRDRSRIGPATVEPWTFAAKRARPSAITMTDPGVGLVALVAVAHGPGHLRGRGGPPAALGHRDHTDALLRADLAHDQLDRVGRRLAGLEQRVDLGRDALAHDR